MKSERLLSVQLLCYCYLYSMRTQKLNNQPYQDYTSKKKTNKPQYYVKESQSLLFKEAYVYGICTVILDVQSPITFPGSVVRDEIC